MTSTKNITKEEKISFQQFHEPKLKSGDYTIEVEQTVSQSSDATGTLTSDPIDTFTAKKRLFVAGERFSIPKGKIYSCFPPQGNKGDHSNDLPSIMLTRSTLPWERFAQETSVANRALTMPWLYLFVFDDNDIQSGYVKVSSKAIQDAVEFASTSGLPSDTTKIGLQSEPGEVSGTVPDQIYKPTKVNVVEIDAAWAQQYNVLPTTTDLGLMTWVRLNKELTTTTPADGGKSTTVTATDPESEMAICIANRLPAPGVRSYAHLLSLESRVDSSGINLTDQGYDGSTFTSFISLTDWSFTCAPESRETFSELLNDLSQNDLALPLLADTVTGYSFANNYLQKGAVPLPHHLKEGGNAVSWYHGPLLGGSGRSETGPVTLPVQQSDDLLLLDKDLGMLNTSYAAAWELGRMLTLNNKSMSMELYAWKRQKAWVQNQQSGDDLFHDLLPAGTKQAKAQSLTDQENKIKTWFQSLNLLENIPFNYLVPDEALLPAESIRFFQLDNYWISCLLDGAFSIGRVTGGDTQLDSLYATLSKYSTGTISGFLLRSQVVSGWPALEVESPTAIPTIPNPRPALLPLLRMDNLGPDILLCLFEGEAKYFDIHLKPESIHFGFNRPGDPRSDPNGYTKDIRFSFTGNVVTQVPADSPISSPIVWRSYIETGGTVGTGANPANSVDLSGVKTSMETAINTSNTAIAKKDSKPAPTAITLNTAQFAMEMVKGVPRVFFSKGTPATLTSPEYKYIAPILAQPTVANNTLGGFVAEGLPPDSAEVVGGNEHQDGQTLAPNTGQSDSDQSKEEFVDNVIAEAETGLKQIAKNLEDKNPEKKEEPKSSELEKVIEELKDLGPEVSDDVKQKLDELENEIEQSPIFDMNSPKIRKAWVIVTLVLLTVSTIIWTVSTIVDRERPEPLIFHFEGVKGMQEIEFVKQDYDELIPIATKDGELEFLLTVPASVNGKMDMTMLQYQLEGDSVIKVTLPHPIISDPVLNLAEVRDYYDRGGGDKLFLSGGGASYSKAYEQIIASMDETKKGILANAIHDDIIEKTNKQARTYLINMAGAIGYRIEFVPNEPDPSWEDDIKKRVGKTWSKVKHKVEGHSGILKRIKDDLTRKKSDDTKTESK